MGMQEITQVIGVQELERTAAAFEAAAAVMAERAAWLSPRNAAARDLASDAEQYRGFARRLRIVAERPDPGLRLVQPHP